MQQEGNTIRLCLCAGSDNEKRKAEEQYMFFHWMDLKFGIVKVIDFGEDYKVDVLLINYKKYVIANAAWQSRSYIEQIEWC
jgi:hypothetical protein